MSIQKNTELTRLIAMVKHEDELKCLLNETATKNTDLTKLIEQINGGGELKYLLDETLTAELLGVTNGTLQVWRCTKRYNLPYVKIGRLVKYRLSDILDFVESRTHRTEV